MAGNYGCSRKEHSPPLPQTVDFNFDIRPILVQKCFLCHGPDPSSREANLRFDTFEGATASLEDGSKAIVPGRPGKSKLLERITHSDPEQIMPPPASNLTLNDREIALLKKWIEQGAEWKPHWAFIPPKAPEIQYKKDKPSNEIDYFVEKKLEQHGLKPASKASKNSLIRRVSYLLTGLPPTPEALQIYLNDNTQNAYEKMVDGYLNSKGFGERWALHWMDVVRYAETKGHEFDYTITGAWKYRDYLIRALNNDVPYDQLVKEHLAGDLLPPRRNQDGSNESLLGTLFYALGEGKHSPVDTKLEEADIIDNIIDVTSKAFLGLTVSCAKCHDHKFDPILTTDYYALYGIMESSRFSPVPSNITLDKELQGEEAKNLKVHLRKIIADQWMAESGKVSAFQLKTEIKKNEIKKEEKDLQIIGEFRGSDFDGWKSGGMAFSQRTTLGNPIFSANEEEIVQLEDGKASSQVYGKGIFGALRSPNFIIDKDFIGVRARGKASSIRIIMDNFQLISYPIYGDMDQKVNTKDWKNFIFDVGQWKGHKAYIEILPGSFRTHVYNLPEDAFVELQYATAFNGDWVELPFPVNNDPFDLKKALQNWANFKSTPDEVIVLNDLLINKQFQEKFTKAADLLKKGQKISENLRDTTFINSVVEGFAINSHVFNRGNYKDLSEEAVPRRFLSAIPVKDSVFNSAGSGRKELAESIFDPENPLATRVMVNRIWHHLFGRGIVETVDNFGLQGKLPSHPELLDFLALKFQNEGWSVKNIIKYMMMSEAFQRSVNIEPEIENLDPENVWLAHYTKRRLEAEIIRDGVIAISGNLDTTMYGPPVPVYINEFMQGRGRPKESGPLDGNGRRSIYQEVRRNFLDPMLLTFDKPIPFSTFGKRNVTNVPAQSLIMMNDPFVAMQAEVFAKNVMEQKDKSLDERIQKIYIESFSRNASLSEIENAKDFILKTAQLYEVEEKDILNDINIWKEYCHSIFNLKEFIFLI
ncbi:hypothetical protein BH23BAC1_BH23BAC1_07350 [soil metagenome]